MAAVLHEGVTVAEIVEFAHLRLRVVAGAGGLDARVTWAHVADIDNPWDWLEPGVMVMMTGRAVPADEAEQLEIVERMAEAGLAGLVVSEGRAGRPATPGLSPAMIAAADRLDIPVILAHYQTSWIEISQLVARMNQPGEARTLSNILRVHDKLRGWLAEPQTSDQLLESLGRVVGGNLYLVDARSWEPLLPDTAMPDERWREALEVRTESSSLIARLAFEGEVDGRSVLAVPLPTDHRDSFLLVDVPRTSRPRLAVIQHVAAACALEVARVESLWRADWWSGAAILTEALEGRASSRSVEASLSERRIGPPYVCIAVDGAFDLVDRLHRYWLVRSVPHLFARASTALFLHTASEERIAEAARFCEREGIRAGASEAFLSLSALSDANQQARWARQAIRPDSSGLARYGANGQTFLPRTLLESQHVIERILGPLLAYDEKHHVGLVSTLQAYLECDRSPRQAAARLHVHHQTIHYRVSRIEELTGRSLRSTADVTELWFALQVLAVSGDAAAGSR